MRPGWRSSNGALWDFSHSECTTFESSYTSKNNCTTSGVTGTVNTNGADLNVRSGPGTSYSILRQVADGQQVTITCQVRGETITGTYGTTSLWDHLAAGGYISDAYVYTGSDGQVAPTCP